MVALLALASPELPQSVEYPPPSPPYVRPTLPVGLPKGPIRYAYLPADGDWVLVTSSGARGTMPGRHGDVLRISRNGLRIAHYA
ncbi:hypothetical protein SAMN05444920_104799 [Nonomuraea solani]|uniref:Uncharacterized protein n=1 Tax=Nonomuraea solani TaxID=1144553 RepID=A0A1H6D4W3_9ACTN|nr:hypothetical protein [Nonomuraea solani]SEG80094.1 hypothetical protein SAMN05444920_104799 [Nonomuraea solani]